MTGAAEEATVAMDIAAAIKAVAIVTVAKEGTTGTEKVVAATCEEKEVAIITKTKTTREVIKMDTQIIVGEAATDLRGSRKIGKVAVEEAVAIGEEAATAVVIQEAVVAAEATTIDSRTKKK